MIAGAGLTCGQLRAEDSAAAGAAVVVARATVSCFSDLVRITGFVVPRRQAVVNVDTEGLSVAELLVHEGDLLSANQEVVRLTPAPGGGASRPPIALRAPAAGLVTRVNATVGAPASPQAGPLLQIAIDNELELNAEAPSIQILKLDPGATARISRDGAADLTGRVRRVAPVIDPRTQLGHIRVSVDDSTSLRVGMFARVAIDAQRSCGVTIPRTALDHSTVQVVSGDVIATRQVRVGLTSGDNAEILEGVKQDELVVANAGASLHDGDRVRPMFADEIDRARGR